MKIPNPNDMEDIFRLRGEVAVNYKQSHALLNLRKIGIGGYRYGGFDELKQLKWDVHYMELAFMWARKSCDTSTRNGCIFVDPEDQTQLAAGYNGLPRGVEATEKRLNERPYKYYWFEHAERNAIDNAARVGVSLKGSTVYLTGYPCASCARGLVNVGTKRLVVPEMEVFAGRGDWKENLEIGALILHEGGVRVQRLLIDVPEQHGENNPLVKDGSGPNI